MIFNNTYINLPSEFYQHSKPSKFNQPKLIIYNNELAEFLGLDLSQYSADQKALFFSGQLNPINSNTHFISLAYAGHQFGHFVPQLGDGRALLLGEILTNKNQRFDLQLKGSGPTYYSRRGDGKSAIGPVLKEYLTSEAMFYLGVPTTRSLAAVDTQETVWRENEKPGGISARVAQSHVRIGTFQYFLGKGDLGNLKILLYYCIQRHFPDLIKQGEVEHIIQTKEKSTEQDEIIFGFFKKVSDLQAKLIAKWMSLGFIHGVMNTDNMTISGETIDYGPSAFMDTFNEHQVFSYIDQNGRYSYANQPEILIWNLARLAECLIPLVNLDSSVAISNFEEMLKQTTVVYHQERNHLFSLKLGLDPNIDNTDLINHFLSYLQQDKLDFTLSFRNLTQLLNYDLEKPIELNKNDDSFFPRTPLIIAFVKSWKTCIKEAKGFDDFELENWVNQLKQINPFIIPRNHLIVKAIDDYENGSDELFLKLNNLFKNPFLENDDNQLFSLPPKQHELVKFTFCGT